MCYLLHWKASGTFCILWAALAAKLQEKNKFAQLHKQTRTYTHPCTHILDGNLNRAAHFENDNRAHTRFAFDEQYWRSFSESETICSKSCINFLHQHREQWKKKMVSANEQSVCVLKFGGSLFCSHPVSFHIYENLF